MKLSLVVKTPGKGEGKTVPIGVPSFVIGRDPECNLRPASAMISKRHCALEIRGNKVFVCDFGSTNGTFVNEQAVKGEVELKNQDQLKVGPLAFQVNIEVPAAPAEKPIKKPELKVPHKVPSKSGSQAADDEAAAMFLSLEDDETPSEGLSLDSEGVPTGSTMFETAAIPPPEAGQTNPKGAKPEEKKAEPAKSKGGDTSSAAQAILEKYMRRNRS